MSYSCTLAAAAKSICEQVTAEFLGSGRFDSTAEKAGKLQQLAACLDKLPESICNLHFLLGNGYGMDSLGRVRLEISDSPNLWAG